MQSVAIWQKLWHKGVFANLLGGHMCGWAATADRDRVQSELSFCQDANSNSVQPIWLFNSTVKWCNQNWHKAQCAYSYAFNPLPTHPHTCTPHMHCLNNIPSSVFQWGGLPRQILSKHLLSFVSAYRSQRWPPLSDFDKPYVPQHLLLMLCI